MMEKESSMRALFSLPVLFSLVFGVPVQARAAGVATGGLPQLRSIVGAGTSLRRYAPLDLIANTATN